jgi:mRNA-degrading endonuclease RelE of RelBE toxin-antitoxin system
LTQKLRVEHYRDASGKEVTDYLMDLIDNGIEEGIRLTTIVLKAQNEGFLPFWEAPLLITIKTPRIGIYFYRKGNYHLIFSYYKRRNEVCFLDVYDRDPKTITYRKRIVGRVLKFYSIKDCHYWPR